MKKLEPDQIINIQIGKLLQATRKHLGLNQTAIAPQLGLDQSAMSRVESGKQILTATQWFNFCKIAGISPDCLMYGTVELNHLESAMRLPPRFSFEKHTKVRALSPMLEYARIKLGERGFDAFLDECKIDPDFFLNLSAEINFNFVIDLTEVLVQKTGMDSKDAEDITRVASKETVHGTLHHLYDYLYTNQLSLISAFIDNVTSYGSNFKYEIVDADKNEIDIAITPLAHMKEFDFKENTLLGDFFAHYDKGFLQNLSAYGDQKQAKVTLMENLYKGAPRCLYRVKTASSR